MIGEAKETVGLVSGSEETSIESTCAPPPEESQAREALELQPVRVRETKSAEIARDVFFKRFNFQINRT